jgi:cytochrome c2
MPERGTEEPMRTSRRRKRPRWIAPLLAAAVLAGCPGDRADRTQVQVAGGDALLGRRLIRDYGCHSCHTIPGVRGADALVGPPLVHWSRRVYVAGLLPNTPENLVAWLENPQRIHPESAMPNMGVTPTHARHIAAYLYTLR